jgi:hypothetical protein
MNGQRREVAAQAGCRAFDGLDRGGPSRWATPPQASPPPSYIYGHHGSVDSGQPALERGPPVTTYEYAALPRVGDDGPRGASARPHSGSIRSYITYDHCAQIVRSADKDRHQTGHLAARS